MSGIDPVTAVVTALAGPRRVRAGSGIDGFGASGKTTLAARVAAALPGAVVIHNDDFARPELPGWDRDRFVRQVVEPLLAGRPGRYQRWDFDADVGAEWHTGAGRGAGDRGGRLRHRRPAAGAVGPHASGSRCRPPYAAARIAERDGPALQDRWLTDWIPMEEAYAADQRPWDRVDLVHVPEPEL